jgi:hypothetical protein
MLLKISGGEDFAPRKLCKISNVSDGILIGDCPSVQCTVVATAFPAVLFLRDKRRGEAQELSERRASEHLELGFCDSEAVRC